MPKPIVQRYLFELRFQTRAGMAGLAPQIIDTFATDDCSIEIGPQAAKLIDARNLLCITITHSNIAVEMEGAPELGKFAKLCQSVLAETSRRALHSLKPLRIGLRQVMILPGLSRAEANRLIMGNLYNSRVSWVMENGRDQLSDVGTVFEFMSNPGSQGRIHFGPWVPESNLLLFLFKDEETLARLEDGFVFDCDFAVIDTKIDPFKNVTKWISEASAASTDRVDKLIRAIGVK